MRLLSKIAGWFAGGVADKTTEVAGKVADIVERWNPGDEKKHQMSMDIQNLIQTSVASARSLQLQTHDTWLDVVIDGANRAIRPFVTITFIGNLFGWWEIRPQGIDPLILGMTETIIIFWFGGRALLKDLPAAIAYMRASGK